MKVTLDKLLTLKQQVRLELETNLLPFWETYLRNTQKEGYTYQLSNTLEKESTPQGLVFHARLLWTFSTLYRFNSELKYIKLARECYRYILAHFLDQEHGGA